jgi:hypothetical protein
LPPYVPPVPRYGKNRTQGANVDAWLEQAYEDKSGYYDEYYDEDVFDEYYEYDEGDESLGVITFGDPDDISDMDHMLDEWVDAPYSERMARHDLKLS